MTRESRWICYTGIVWRTWW